MKYLMVMNLKLFDDGGAGGAGGEGAGGGNGGQGKAGYTFEQAEEIAKTKMPDLNAADLESATEMIKGTARSMGVTVTE